LKRIIISAAVVVAGAVAAGDTHIEAGKPDSKPYVERVPISPARPTPKRYTICGIAGAKNCWEVGTPIR